MFNKLTTKQKMIKLGEEMIGMMIERTQRGKERKGSKKAILKDNQQSINLIAPEMSTLL